MPVDAVGARKPAAGTEGVDPRARARAEIAQQAGAAGRAIAHPGLGAVNAVVRGEDEPAARGGARQPQVQGRGRIEERLLARETGELPRGEAVRDPELLAAPRFGDQPEAPAL